MPERTRFPSRSARALNGNFPISGLPRHIPEVLGAALVKLVDLIGRAQANDIDLRKRMGENSRIKTLFKALPTATLPRRTRLS